MGIDGYPAFGGVVWYLLTFASGCLAGGLVDHLFWRHRYARKRADAGADTARAALRLEAGPLLGAIAEALGGLGQMPDGQDARAFLFGQRTGLHQSAARLDSLLAPRDRDRLHAAVRALCDRSPCHSQEAREAARALQSLVHSFLG